MSELQGGWYGVCLTSVCTVIGFRFWAQGVGREWDLPRRSSEKRVLNRPELFKPYT